MAGRPGRAVAPRPRDDIAQRPRIESATSPTVKVIRTEMQRNLAWDQWALLLADLHWDHPLCQRDLLRRHLDQAVERDAVICIFGDAFCLMQGKYDRRADKSSVRPEHQNDRYLDSVVETAVEWFLPYKDHLLFVSHGNHETAIRKHHETDVLQRFAALLNARGGSVAVGTYAGWLQWRFEVHTPRGNNVTRTVTMAYTHGYGGGGPVTKGTIQTNRRAVYLPDANIVVSGHIHESWQLEVSRERVTATGRTFNDVQTHIQLGTYKEESLEGEGWHRERGGPPKPLGGQWVRFYSHLASSRGPKELRGVEEVRYSVMRTEQ